MEEAQYPYNYSPDKELVRTRISGSSQTTFAFMRSLLIPDSVSSRPVHTINYKTLLSPSPVASGHLMSVHTVRFSSRNVVNDKRYCMC